MIRSEKSKDVDEIKKSEIDIKKIKSQIEKLREIKEDYNDNREFEEAIEVSKKIIAIAFSNNLKEIINEEQKFLELAKNKIKIQSEGMEILENQDNSKHIKQEIKEFDLSTENVKLKSKKVMSVIIILNN